VGDPITDPLQDAPPKALTDKVAFAQSTGPSTFRFPGDRHRSESSRWFASGAGTHPVRDGNEVMYLIDGPQTFAEMARVMGTATDASKHFIYILAWSLFLDFPFDASGATAATILSQADSRGIQIRALSWGGFLGVVTDAVKAVATINGFKNGKAFKDDRTLFAGAHHQKVVVVNGSEGLTAFLGGIDIDPNRAFPMGVNGSNFAGAPFHDVHCRIRGAAAWDVLNTFVERWSDFVRAGGVAPDAPVAGGPLLGKSVTVDSQPTPGRLHVQIGRTYPNSTSHNIIGPPNGPSSQLSPYSFAPTGETSLSAMFFQAIGAAKQFIYIEDQYLVHTEASDALVKALSTIAHLTVVFPHSDLTDMPHVWEHRKKFIDPLRAAGGKKVRIFVRSPFGAQIAHSYVHAKTWIFDDQYAIIGTANVNRRSWTHDSEIVAGVYDESTDDHASYTFAHRLRIRLWAEHLNMNDPAGHAALADGVASAVHWTFPGTGIVPYDENEKTDAASVASWDTNVDPDGR
jgi:phosphatidylserine/phosphatidylglycerophosphate/cardiolipin synthase-like enzyme